MKISLHNLVCVRGREVFGLSLWAYNTKHALKLAKSLLAGSGYNPQSIG